MRRLKQSRNFIGLYWYLCNDIEDAPILLYWGEWLVGELLPSRGGASYIIAYLCFSYTKLAQVLRFCGCLRFRGSFFVGNLGRNRIFGPPMWPFYGRKGGYRARRNVNFFGKNGAERPFFRTIMTMKTQGKRVPTADKKDFVRSRIFFQLRTKSFSTALSTPWECTVSFWMPCNFLKNNVFCWKPEQTLNLGVFQKKIQFAEFRAILKGQSPIGNFYIFRHNCTCIGTCRNDSLHHLLATDNEYALCQWIFNG